MLRNTTLAVLTVLALAASSQAAIIISGNRPQDGVDTPGLAGFKTFTLVATSDVAGELINGVDFAGDGSNDPATGKGFFGPLNQINPFGFPTIYNDSNAAITATGGNPLQDSQFMVNSAQVVVPSGLSEEGPNILQGIWAWADPIGQSVQFAQLVIPTASTAPVNGHGSFAVRQGASIVDTPNQRVEVNGGVVVVDPPVVTSVDLGDRIQGAIINHQFVATGTPPIMWGNLVINGPGAPANAPSLTAGGAFSWNSHGSPFGQYTFTVTADNTAAGAGGGTGTGSLRVNIIIPEPATMTLFGLAMVGMVGFGFRKRS